MAAHTYTKEAHQKAVRKYETENTKQLAIRLNLKTDADIIEYIDTLENKRAYILGLIRADMENKKNR